MAPKSKSYEAFAIGKRKTSVARVYISNGKGKITVNDRAIDDYFGRPTCRYVVNQPLELLKVQDKYDLNINIMGGGDSGQAGAARLGIARALLKLDPTVKKALRDAGFLTRDSRIVERKKAGLAGARRSYQFSKR